MTVVVKKSPALYKGKKQKAAAISRKRIPKVSSPPFDPAPVAGEQEKGKIKKVRSLQTITAAAIEIEKLSDTVATAQHKSSPAYSATIPINAIEKAGKEASTVAMEMMGYTIVELKGVACKKIRQRSDRKNQQNLSSTCQQGNYLSGLKNTTPKKARTNEGLPTLAFEKGLFSNM